VDSSQRGLTGKVLLGCLPPFKTGVLCYNGLKVKREMKENKKKTKVAFFDIDGTIFRSSLLIELTESLIQGGIFPQEAREIYAGAFNTLPE